MNIDDLVNFFLFFFDLLVSANQMQNLQIEYYQNHRFQIEFPATHLQSIDEVVNLSHEAFHENDLRQTDAHVPELRWERLHFTEIVQLHGRGKVQEHMR